MASSSLPQYFGVGSLATYAGLEQVGEGTYGFVYKAKDQKTLETVALKRLLFHKSGAGFPLNAVRELKFLKCLKHKNIVQLKDVVTSRGCEQAEKLVKTDTNRTVEKKAESENENEKKPDGDILSLCGNLYLVFEFVEHDLGGLLDSKYRFNTREVKCIAKQLFEVLEYLSEKKVLHRDIKSSNILLTNRHQVKLADFGLARSIQSADGRELRMDLTNNVVTMWYKAPELLLGAVRYAHAIDVWSTGCVIAELELGRPLFPGRTEIEQVDLLCRTLGTPDENVWTGVSRMPHFEAYLNNNNNNSTPNTSLRSSLTNKLSDGVIDLLERVLVFDPTRRPSAKILLNNKYFLTQPLPPIDPADLEPLQVGAGISYHEFRSKQQKRQREEGVLGGSSSVSEGLNKRSDSNTSLAAFSVGSNSSSAGVGGSSVSNGISSSIVNGSIGVASAVNVPFAAPLPPTAPPLVPPTFATPAMFQPSQQLTLPTHIPPPPTALPTAQHTTSYAPMPPPVHPWAPNMNTMNSATSSNSSLSNTTVSPRPPQPALPMNAGSVNGMYGSNTNTSGGVKSIDSYSAPIAPGYNSYNTTKPIVDNSNSTYGANVQGVQSGIHSAAVNNAYNTYNSGNYGGRGGRGGEGRGGGRGGRGEYAQNAVYSSGSGGGVNDAHRPRSPYNASTSGYGAPVLPASGYGAAIGGSSAGGGYGAGSSGGGYCGGNNSSSGGTYGASGSGGSMYGQGAAQGGMYGSNGPGGSYGGSSGNAYGSAGGASSGGSSGYGNQAQPHYPHSTTQAYNAGYNTAYSNNPVPPRGPRGPPGPYNNPNSAPNPYNNPHNMHNSNNFGGRGYGNYRS